MLFLFEESFRDTLMDPGSYVTHIKEIQITVDTNGVAGYVVIMDAPTRVEDDKGKD